MTSFLCGLLLEAILLVSEISFDSFFFFFNFVLELLLHLLSYEVLVLCIFNLPDILFMSKPFVLLINAVLNFLFQRLLSMNWLKLHFARLLFKSILQLSLLLHDLIIVSLLRDPLLVRKLLFHLILDFP